MEFSINKKFQVNRESDQPAPKNKKPLDESRIHEGHRARLLDTLYNVGIENVSDVQAMEFMLFYVFPRGDVNPLAHRLLHEFQSVAGVLDADIISLSKVKGMGLRSAKSLKMLGDLFFYYTQNKLAEKTHLENYTQMCDYFEELLRFEPKEKFYIIGLDASYRIILKKTLAVGSVKNVGIAPDDITRFVDSCKPAALIFAHNHPGGNGELSTQDIEATDKLEVLIKCLGVKLIDHLVVGIDGIGSYRQKGKLRKFY